MCPALVTFQDGRREKPSERCVGTGEAERKHLVHMSKGHNLQISVNAQHIPGMDVNFLLKTEGEYFIWTSGYVDGDRIAELIGSGLESL